MSELLPVGSLRVPTAGDLKEEQTVSFMDQETKYVKPFTSSFPAFILLYTLHPFSLKPAEKEES